MCGIADTGARLNIGDLDYHHLVSNMNTHIVVHMKMISDIPKMNPLNISGVADNEEGV